MNEKSWRKARPDGYKVRYCLKCGKDTYPNWFYCPTHHAEKSRQVDMDLIVAGQSASEGHSWRCSANGKHRPGSVSRVARDGGEMGTGNYSGMVGGSRK